MSRRCASLVGLALASAVPALHAGNVHRVGPGQPFADVQAAVNAAGNGDLVLVEPGTYPAFEVGSPGLGPKSLAIVARDGSFTLAPLAGGPEIRIENVPFGRTVTVIGAHIDFADPAAPAVLVRNNRGAVRLSELDVVQTGFLHGASLSAVVEVENTRTFWLSDSSVWGAIQVGDTTDLLCVGGLCNDGISGVQLTDSSGVIQSSRVSGYENSAVAAVTRYGGDGLRLIGESSVWLLENEVGGKYGARFRGGAGLYGGHAIHQVRTPIFPGLNRSCGGLQSPAWQPGARLLVGMGSGGGFYGFNNDNGIFGGGIGPPVIQFPEICGPKEANECSIQGSLVPLGGDLVVRLWTRLARGYLLLIDDSTRHAIHPSLAGRTLLGYRRPLLASSGLTQAQTTRVLRFPVPTDPALIGMQLTAQMANGLAGGALEALSLPSFAVIGP